MFGEVNPTLGWVHRAVPAAGFDAGRDGEAGDGVTDHLTLTAAEAADRIAHEENLGEVFAAQGRAAEVFSGAELALDGNTVVGVQSEVRGAFLGGVGAVSPACAFVFVLEFHLYVIIFPGEVEGRRASPLCAGDCSGYAARELGELLRVRRVSKESCGDREGLSEVCGVDVFRLWVRRCRWRERAAVLCV